MARPGQRDGQLPALRLLAIHGAGTGPWVFGDWPDTVAPDLQAGLNVAAASMLNYEAVAARAAEGLERPLVLVGWSMGGLVAMMAARRVEPDRLVLLEPSPPAEVQGVDENVPLREGLFDPEDVYGPLPVRSRPESSLARAERKRGISVPALPCPALVVYGDDFPDERGRRLAAFYDAEELHLPGRSHLELVLGKKAAREIVSWAR